MPLPPLRFEPIYLPKVWGGRKLEHFGRRLPESADSATGRIGESWELADMDATQPGGGGGAAARSIVAAGPLAGTPLRTLLETRREELIGNLPLTDDDRFPLLVKYLDAGQSLSLQAHPSKAYAQLHPEARFKCEAWYIVDAEPGAKIYKGIREGVTPDAFRKAIESDNLESLMIAMPARPGDYHYLPSGTCHALGAGILVAEVQTPSDTTFRVFDWGRTGRELHIDAAMACIDFGPVQSKDFEPGTRLERDGVITRDLVNCEHFHLLEHTLPADYALQIPWRGEPVIWVILNGSGKITSPSDAYEPMHLAPLQTWLMPASLDALHITVDPKEPLMLLEITFPEIGARTIA